MQKGLTLNFEKNERAKRMLIGWYTQYCALVCAYTPIANGWAIVTVMRHDHVFVLHVYVWWPAKRSVNQSKEWGCGVLLLGLICWRLKRGQICLNKVLPKSNKRSNQEKKLKDGGNLKIPQKIPWKIVFPLIFPFFVFPLSFPSEGRFSPRRGIYPSKWQRCLKLKIINKIKF